MESDHVNRTKSLKKKQKSRGGGPAALPRRHNRRNSLQLPKGVRVLLSPRNPYEEFHKLFKDIPKDEFPINVKVTLDDEDYSCALSRDILLHGRLFVSQNWICFYSNIFGWETLVQLECKKIKSISRAKTARMFPNAILIRTEKKKYLFCSFLTRDAAHKLLTTVWQESNSQRKPDSGVDEISANGDQDEESVVEESSEFNENEIPLLAQTLQSSKDPLLSLKQPQRTISCPNTSIAHHTSVPETIAANHTNKGHVETHVKEHQYQKKIPPLSSMQKYLNAILTPVIMLLDSFYHFFSSLGWLFKRNQISAEVFLLFSSILFVVLLMSTVTFMDRISKLEKIFHNTLPLEGIPELDKKSDQLSVEYLEDLLKNQESRFHIKTERLNQALAVLLLSIENVKCKLKLIKDELTEQTDAEQSKIVNNYCNMVK